MNGKEESLKRAKELLLRIEDTQESIVMTSDLFLLLSAKGYSKDLVALWLSLFNVIGSRQKLCYLYLVNHIVQNERKDEGKLKELFREAIGRAFEKAYKLSEDKDIRKRLLYILVIWKERNVYESSLLEQIEKSLLAMNINSDKSKKAAAPSAALAKYEQIVVPRHLVDIGENLRLYGEWREKLDSMQEVIRTILKQQGEFTELETQSKIAEYERAVQQSKRHAELVQQQLVELLKSEDKNHLQEVLLIKKMQELIADVHKTRLERSKTSPQATFTNGHDPSSGPVSVPASGPGSNSVSGPPSAPITVPPPVSVPIPIPIPIPTSPPVSSPVPTLCSPTTNNQGNPKAS